MYTFLSVANNHRNTYTDTTYLITALADYHPIPLFIHHYLMLCVCLYATTTVVIKLCD